MLNEYIKTMDKYMSCTCTDCRQANYAWLSIKTALEELDKSPTKESAAIDLCKDILYAFDKGLMCEANVNVFKARYKSIAQQVKKNTLSRNKRIKNTGKVVK